MPLALSKTKNKFLKHHHHNFIVTIKKKNINLFLKQIASININMACPNTTEIYLNNFRIMYIPLNN